MNTGKYCLTLCTIVVLQAFVLSSPYEATEWSIPKSEIDKRVERSLSKQNEGMASCSSDAAFVRRVSLDLCGTLPDREVVGAFLKDRSPDKRIRLIDTLIESDRYVEFSTLRWCDLLRVKSEYPVNLWPNAVQAYHRWIWEAVRENRPFDKFAKELLTASGSNFRLPASNFYRVAPTKEPRDLAGVLSFTFLGQPLESLDGAEGLSDFFKGLGFKRTQEWKEEIVYWGGSDSEEVEYHLPDESSVRLQAFEDPRPALANWVVSEPNRWFAKSAVNRIWYWYNGYGLYEDPDDISSRCVNEDLVDYLVDELVSSKYNLQHVLRLVLASRVYQQSCVPCDVGYVSPFSAYQIRPLEAEVLADALADLIGIRFQYTSPIPEPFTFIPKDIRSISLADGSITSPFLETFGRPSRDSGRLGERSEESTASQRLYLLNSEDMHRHLNGKRLMLLLGESARNQGEWFDALYLSILSRKPTPIELRKFSALKNGQGGKARRDYIDLAWALFNSKEFQFKH